MAVLAFLRKSPKRTSQLLLFFDGLFYGINMSTNNLVRRMEVIQKMENYMISQIEVRL